jgi:hypothetical protein
MTVRTAVLVLEHQQPQRLAALLRSLDHPDIDVYVHVDARVSRVPFQKAAPTGPRVTFLDDADRVAVSWGALSLVDASVATLRVGLDSGRGYGRYALLSGADVRISPLGEILAAWSTPAEFMRIDRALTGPDRQPNWRVRRRHFQETTGRIGRTLSGRFPRRIDETMDLYQGSQWWALTGGAARYVCEFIDSHPDWLRFHRRTFGPDEIVIQSILANSPFARRITQNHAATGTTPEADSRLHGMHYIDWSDATASSPRELSIEDLPVLRRSPAFFARKIGSDSADLVAAFERDFADR